MLPLTVYLSNYRKQSPWEANSSSASQEIPVLCGTKVYCHVYESLPPLLVWSQMNHFLATDPISWRSILILSSGLPSGHFLRFPNQDSVCTSPLPHTCHIPRLSHFWVDHRIVSGEQYRSWSCLVCCLLCYCLFSIFVVTFYMRKPSPSAA